MTVVCYTMYNGPLRKYTTEGHICHQIFHKLWQKKIEMSFKTKVIERNVQLRFHLLLWIESFLPERSQCVTVDGFSSKSAPVRSGVPQGTVLGPLLLLCYINDSTQMMHFHIDRPIRNASDHEVMQQDLCRLEAWANRWDINFNPISVM